MELNQKLSDFFARLPGVKAKADNIQATLEELGIKSKEAETGAALADAPTVETKEMNDVTPATMEKKEDEAKEPKGENEEEKETAAGVEKKEVDTAAILTAINEGVQASVKETAELKSQLAAVAKEYGEFKVLAETGFSAVKQALEARDEKIQVLEAQRKQA